MTNSRPATVTVDEYDLLITEAALKNGLAEWPDDLRVREFPREREAVGRG